jgi:uracil-DNA glycosylase
LVVFIKSEFSSQSIYPNGSLIFNAFDQCTFDDVKVVILGQDPYHGEGKAHGLSFSVPDGVKQPPSLKNIFKEIHFDLGINPPESGNLLRWANQGVLLLNSILTVKKGKPGSHQMKGWEVFTDSVIEILSQEKENLVFMLWGAYAYKKGEKINRNKHLVIETSHPSPFSADKGFFKSKQFSKCNDYLEFHKKGVINW